ncbi:MAG: hypothetical protein ACM3N0_01175 [Chloroflexota bacterium]
MSRRALTAVLALVALGACAAPVSAAPHGLQLGLAEESFASSNPSARERWTSRARDAGADLALLDVVWSEIAPRKLPAGFEPANPADPAYRWTALDDAVRSAVAAGMQPVLEIDYAPAWAEGVGRPSEAVAPPGTWQPQPQALGEFARALASRYSGDYVDPTDSAAGPLPRVRYFQIWAEQNLSVHLNPLWRGRRLVAPGHYRAMLNAAYAAIHAADPGARVIVGGLAPYGDARPGGQRIPPVWFWRSLLCLRGARLRPVRCPHPAHFDIAAHNPIDVFGPTVGATSRLDVSVPDIGRLQRIVRKAVATRRLLPARGKPFWATEIWWDSNPPDPLGVPVAKQAGYLTQALFGLWRQGVSAVVWWYLRDQAPGSAGYGATLQSGLLYRDGRPKPAYAAFRFPFVAQRRSGGRLLLWGRAPRAGRVTIERRARRGWAPIAHPATGADGVFVARLRGSAGALRLRARQGTETSRSWRLRR